MGEREMETADLVLYTNIAFAACFELLFGPRERPFWKRVPIWLGGGLVLWFGVFFVCLLSGLNLNEREGRDFFHAMLRLTAVDPEAPACTFRVIDYFLPWLLQFIIAASIVCGIPAAILLKWKKGPRFLGWLLFIGLLIAFLLQFVCWPITRMAEGAATTRRYYLACQAEIERINTLDLDETERNLFYEETVMGYHWTYEGSAYNYRQMEELLNRLKDYPPAPKE